MAIDLYFNEEKHKYTDANGNVYTSMTTVIGKYEVKFDTEKMSKIVIKSKKSQYYGWTAQRVKAHWKELNERSLIKGNRVHNQLEEAVKKASGYELIDGKYINDKIYTVNNFNEILATNETAGELDLEFFIKQGMDIKYPRIFKVIAYYVSHGYRIFSEIGIFDESRLISGLIDILLINLNTKEFIVLDWKTNKHELVPFQDERYKWISGYFKKDKRGFDTHEFVKTNTFFKHPLSKYQQSHYLIYALQLSGYTALVEKLGYKSNGIILAHIREELTYNDNDPEVFKTPACAGKVRTDIYTMHYLKDDINGVFNHHYEHSDRQNTLNL